MPIEQYRATTARALLGEIERAIADGSLHPGEQLPTVRALAMHLGLSPATVASAYRELARRGVVQADGRRGTRVRPRPPLASPPPPRAPEGVKDLSIGLPDPQLLPQLSAAVRAAAEQVTPETALRRGNNPELLALAQAMFAADGIAVDGIGVVGGALDGIERALSAHLRPGDVVAVEDPGFPPLLDLLGALGLEPRSVPVDEQGQHPEALERVLRSGVRAIVITPRAQNPTGAALSPDRATQLRRILDQHPDVLLVEDDHAGPITGVPPVTLTARRHRWAIVRSVSKWLSPDLRLALIAADPTTLIRIEGRQLVGTGWVSGILQATVLAACRQSTLAELSDRAAARYAERREALVDALIRCGLDAYGRSGLNVWVPVADEDAATRALLTAGYQAAAGSRFRLSSPPGIRVTVATMDPAEAPHIAATIATSQAPAPHMRTY